MSDKSHISWTDATWIPVTGCTRVSPGCDHCYAFQLHDQRHIAFKRCRWPTAPQQYHQPFSRVQLLEERLTQPLRWREPRRIFVTSMGDLFHEDVPDEFLDRVFAVMALTPQHTYQVLTKRPERMREYLAIRRVIIGAAFLALSGDTDDARLASTPWPLPNVWIGTSVEDQERADERIPELLATPAAVRFLSCEPLLGPVDLRLMSVEDGGGIIGRQGIPRAHFIHWIICGGESGPRFRPMETEWALSLKRQCDAAGVAFWAKQGSGRKSEQPFGHPELDGARAFPAGVGR